MSDNDKSFSGEIGSGVGLVLSVWQGVWFALAWPGAVNAEWNAVKDYGFWQLMIPTWVGAGIALIGLVIMVVILGIVKLFDR